MMLFDNGFKNLLEEILNNLLPAKINLEDIFNLENIMIIFNLKLNQIIVPKIYFFQNQKNRILFLDILISMILIKKDFVREMFFGREQEKKKFHLFKKLVIWQVLTKEPRERYLLNSFMLFLFFDSLTEIILTNRAIPFGSNNRK